MPFGMILRKCRNMRTVKPLRNAPEPVQEHRRVRRYQYEMMGIVYPQYAEKNVLIDYGVIEEAE